MRGARESATTVVCHAPLLAMGIASLNPYATPSVASLDLLVSLDSTVPFRARVIKDVDPFMCPRLSAFARVQTVGAISAHARCARGQE